MSRHSLAVLTAGLSVVALAAVSGCGAATAPVSAKSAHATTPIKHVVVLFDENVSFDHYFATYPYAANKPNEVIQGSHAKAAQFHPSSRTPKNIATLRHDKLLGKKNPNLLPPKRLTPAQAVTCDQNHGYGAEQKAYNNGKMNKFVEETSKDKCASAGNNMTDGPGMTMRYFDGNTVTAMWNYAQYYAMSDNSFSVGFGPSTPGAINLISGNTHGVSSYDPKTLKKTKVPDSYAVQSPDKNGVGTMINDPDPAWDDCSNDSHASKNNLAALSGRNIGDKMNSRDVSWGWFQGGFRPTTKADGDDPAACERSHTNAAGQSVTDYSPHHEPFQYYRSTANRHHLAPRSLKEVGHDGRANHQYDLSVFNRVVNSNKMPAVSFLKAASYQDGHAGYSDPVDEQHFLVREINAIQKSKNWKNTAIIIAYDDSDGWYDHVAGKVKNASNDTSEDGDAKWCKAAAKNGTPIAGGYADRCGPGPRQPLLVISPYAKKNFVDHTKTDQASIIKFIERNWKLGRIGDHSADRAAGTLHKMFNFNKKPKNRGLILNRRGEVVSH